MEGAAVEIGSGPGLLVVAGPAVVAAVAVYVAAADVERVAWQAAAEKELQ